MGTRALTDLLSYGIGLGIQRWTATATYMPRVQTLLFEARDWDEVLMRMEATHSDPA